MLLPGITTPQLVSLRLLDAAGIVRAASDFKLVTGFVPTNITVVAPPTTDMATFASNANVVVIDSPPGGLFPINTTLQMEVWVDYGMPQY